MVGTAAEEVGVVTEAAAVEVVGAVVVAAEVAGAVVTAAAAEVVGAAAVAATATESKRGSQISIAPGDPGAVEVFANRDGELPRRPEKISDLGDRQRRFLDECPS